MKSGRLATGVVVAILLGLQAQAQDGARLATSTGCMKCHAIDAKKIGPSFRTIAAKYANNADGGTTILAELENGKGHPKISASDADLKAVIDYVLSVR